MTERAWRLDPPCDYLTSTDFPVVAAYRLTPVSKRLEMLAESRRVGS
jgi:hypothetical protein